MGYTYLACDLRTNAILAELPLAGVRWDDELNEPGSLSGSINLYDTRLRVQDVRDATLPARTALYVDLDGVLVHGGIIWKRRRTTGGLEIETAGFLSYFARQRITALAEFSSVDQFTIVRDLLTAVAGKPGGDIGLDLGSGTSGVNRDRTYPAEDNKQVLEAIQQLSQVINGFDLAINVAYDEDNLPGKNLVLGYPRLGRRQELTELLLEYPGNVSEYTWPEEGDRMVTTALVRGEGETDTTPTASLTNATLIAGGYPSLEDEWSFSGVTVQATVDDYAEALLAAHAAPVVLPSFTIPAGIDDPPLASYGPGDDVHVRITDSTWWPETSSGTPGYDGYMRLVRRSVAPDPGGAGQQVELTMSPFLGVA
jgi:hypothetical protein